jgi:outer membrane immunogenic protein
MKKYLLASVAALGLVAAGAATAADLPSRKGPVLAPIAYAPVFTWTGFYVGVNAGYGWGTVDSTNLGILPTFSDPDGFIGGGQIGYNYQMGQIVLGVEADFQGADLKASVTGGGFTARNELNYFGTVRARVGYAVDRFLPYVTGGFAYANVKTAITGPGIGFSDDSTQYGYAIGAGLEYAFTNNLTAKIEYLYVDLERERINTVFGTTGAKVGTDFSVVRAGLNYKF